MRTVTCNGLEKDWSVITFGCWQIAPSAGWGDVCSKKDADFAVKEALEQGITAFDTAEGYGDGESERRLGQALGPRKEDVIIISKIWPDAELTLPSYRKQLEDSLKALGREYVDVYLIHWPGSYFNNTEKSARLVEFMNTLKKNGKATTIGLSNFQSQDLTLLGDKLKIFSMNEVPYSLLDRAYEGSTLNLCKNADIPYMAFSPTAQGLLAKPMSREDLEMPTRKHHFLYQDPVYPHAQRTRKIRTRCLETFVGPVDRTERILDSRNPHQPLEKLRAPQSSVRLIIAAVSTDSVFTRSTSVETFSSTATV